jgi:hypothetical protein
LSFDLSTRVPDLRAIAGATVLGSLVGFAIGGAYLAGGLAHTAVLHARISKLADAAHVGFSDRALSLAAADAPGALAIARRHDPEALISDSAHDRRLEAWVDRLQARRGAVVPPRPEAPMLVRASLPGVEAVVSRAVAIAPFRMRGALDQSRDLECLTTAIYYEARGESAAGQAAVAQVVLNRVRHRLFPKTICGVVFQGATFGGCQFSFACDGSTRRGVDTGAWDRAKRVAAQALDGSVSSEVGDATHFHVAGIRAGWGPQLARVAQIGAHVFYRLRGQSADTAFNGEVQPSAMVASSVPSPYSGPALASLAPGGGAAAPQSPSPVNSLLQATTSAVEHAAASVESAVKPKMEAPAPAASVKASGDSAN